MVYLNFTDLSEEAQNRLLEDSKKDCLLYTSDAADE